MSFTEPQHTEQIHTEEIQDIISKPPAWLLRWGISSFFAILILIGCLSAFIRYPDLVKTKLRISSASPPKPIVTPAPVRLVKLLVNNGQPVTTNMPLAYIESTASHEHVLNLLRNCKLFEQNILSLALPPSISFQNPNDLQLGELLLPYQKFYTVYLSSQASLNDELGSKPKLQRIRGPLTHLISAIEAWKNKYILTSTYSGRVFFAGILEEKKLIDANQPIFYISDNNENLYGEVYIPQYSISKVKIGQEVLVKLQSYPYEEYGIITGKLSYISEISVKDSAFVAKVSFDTNKFHQTHKPVNLKYGMQADAEIITEETSALKRILGSLFKIIY